ncbi:MAG: transglutaminase domain-containing protein [bacterium]
MRRISYIFLLITLCACATWAISPTLEIDKLCPELVPLFKEISANETFVTSLVSRDSDDLVFGASCGKKKISLFSFNHKTSQLNLLDCFDALWWDEPVLALGPNGDVYLGSKCVWDKQFVFERLRERPITPDAQYRRRDVIPSPCEVNENAEGMRIRHYSAEGYFLGEIPLPESLAKDGVGAMVISSDGRKIYGLSSPGGHLFTISLETGKGKDLGEVVRFAQHHHTRRISKVLMEGPRGMVYLCGSVTPVSGEYGDDDVMGVLLALDPETEALTTMNSRLPAVVGRRRFAAIDAAVQLGDGSYIGGTTDGYLFRFDPATDSLEGFGKPIRQHNIVGLALGPEGLVYGAGGEPGGLPRLFAFDPNSGEFHLGMPPTGNPSPYPSTFGDIGAVVSTSDGTLICGERERRGYLLVYRPRPASPAWSKIFSGADFKECTRDRFVNLTDETYGFHLAPTYLQSDNMARSSKIQETLGENKFIRKAFDLHSTCKAVEILFYGGGGTEETPMLIEVNGNRIWHVQDESKMLSGGWDRVTIPMKYLRLGQNEILFSQNGWLIVDTDSPGGNSGKRFGYSGPWRSDILGPDDNLEGEYAIRVRVHGYPEKGVVTSPILDLAAFTMDESVSNVPPCLAIDQIRLTSVTDEPRQTSVRFEVRSGPTPDYEAAQWSIWYQLGAIDDMPKNRFFQWRATLSSSDMNVTPRLEQVVVEISGEISGENRDHVTLTMKPDNTIATSSYSFDYANPHHPRMRHLREKYHLEDVVAPGKTETEKLALLRQWVREQWEGWDMGKYNYCPQWDALEILELAPAKLGLGMCTHYAAVFVQCAAALGYHAREVIVDHHCLAETWSDDYGKWILQDVGLIAKHFISFQYEKDGVPLNALELHERYLNGSAGDVDVVPDPPYSEEQYWKNYLSLYCRFGIALRNDHLYRPLPQELEHGKSQYHWDGYLWWTDSLDPKYPEYSLNTNRPEDFYWTLNKTLIDLQDTDTPGGLSVRLHGPIPNLDTFVIQVNGGEWKRSDRKFTWDLQPGRNTLAAKAINTMGVEGRVNHVVLEYTP